MSAPRYRVRLCFEWGGGSLWPADRTTTERFGDGPLDRRGLPLSAATLARLSRLAAVHDTAWDTGLTRYIPWSPEQVEQFNQRARALLAELCAELGSQFAVEYVEHW